MNQNQHRTQAVAIRNTIALGMTILFQIAALSITAQQSVLPEAVQQPANDSSSGESRCKPSAVDSVYIPVDSWIYPAVIRLYAMGYASDVFLGMRPWTRSSVSHMLEKTSAQIQDAGMYGDSTAGEALNLYQALNRELHSNAQDSCLAAKVQAGIESSYSAARAISGTPLDDSFHLGSSIINDYGRPFEKGFNNYSGMSGYASAGRFLLYARGEFQGAPSATGYSQTLAQTLSAIDETSFLNAATGLPYNQATIPMGPITSTIDGRFIEAYVSTQLLSHIISFGKQDDWLGPGQGAGMAYSNNAENIYSFRINRIEPITVPLLSRLTGPFRYDFLVGKLRGHTYMPNPAYVANPSSSVPNVINPGDAWVHVEKFSFKPTRDLEFGFERTVIWGGQGHEPITLRTFLKSFFSTNATDPSVKFTAQDPGARFGAFDFSYRLPFPRYWLTLYTDMEAHDAPSPIAKPLHGTFRPGLYLSHLPGIPKLDMRVEGADTDSSVASTPSYGGSLGGRYQYWETIQRQGYTNNGQLFGDWIGREDKGGQGWITYHLSGNEWLQLGLRNQKASKDFIPGGTTLNDINFQAVKRVGRDFEINGNFTYERYKAPIYLPGEQTVTTTTIQFTWFPERRVSF
jgi:hypothetical protein